MVGCFYSVIAYPYYILEDLPPLHTNKFWFLVGIEIIFIFEIAFGFFLQEKTQTGSAENLPLLQVGENYIKKKLLYDLIALFPFGYLGTFIDTKLRILWYIKCHRMKYLLFLFNPRLFQPVINWYIERKQNLYLNDQEKKKETNEDLIFITLKIFVKNIMKIFSLIIKITMIVYIVANLWFVFVYLQGDIMYNKREFGLKNYDELIDQIVEPFDEDFHPTFIQNTDWDIQRQNVVQGQSLIIIQMYFMMTSLSTVGFGDYYPKNDYERIGGSFILLAGVTVFSYIMMKLADMIINFSVMNGESQDNQEIEDFFLLLKKFNYNFPIEAGLQQEIREFMNLRHNFDRLNFLKTEADHSLLQQLPAII